MFRTTPKGGEDSHFSSSGPDEVYLMENDGAGSPAGSGFEENGKKQVRLLIPEEESLMDTPVSGDKKDLPELKTYTQERVSFLAAPPDVPRPRGLFRSVTSVSPRSRDTKGQSIFVATRANKYIIQKSTCSRITYTFVLLNVVLFAPVWLKLITIQRRDYRERYQSVYNESVKLTMDVSSGMDSKNHDAHCRVCDRRYENQAGLNEYAIEALQYRGVTYPISAHLEDYQAPEHNGNSPYVLLYGTHDFKVWELYNQPGMLTGLQPGQNDVEICRGDSLMDDDDDDDGDDYDDESRKKTTFKDVLQDQVSLIDDSVDGYSSILHSTEVFTEWATTAPTTKQQQRTPAPTPAYEDTVSRCCLGNPGYAYLVACATPYEALAYEQLNAKVAGPPFEDRCVAIEGRCGVQCGVAATAPEDETCINGKIPKGLLLSPEVLGYGSRKYENRHYDRRHDIESVRSLIYHTLFVVFVTVMAVSTWISFLPGNGIARNSPKPSMTEIEEYMATNDEQAKPLCLVAFSISASEPRMMVLRNMCGKLMSWVNQRKFSLLPRNPAESIYTDDAQALSTIFGDDEDGSTNYRNRAAFVQNNSRKTTKDDTSSQGSPGCQSQCHDHSDNAEMVDIFQDEGHRVGAYALWDAFVDVIHDSDLRFVEALASKMIFMNANDDRLSGKKTDDGELLDEDLKNFRKRPFVGISKEDVDKLELAFACFDLLTKLGHHAFWRSDRDVSVVGFRELSANSSASATLKKWAATWKIAKKKGATDPFDHDICPTDDPSIPQEVWMSWWELYSELGRVQWTKRFDTTKFRLARLHYYREVEETGMFRDLMMCYAARANPEDISEPLAPTRNVRGIRKGVFVRLKEPSDEKTADKFAEHGLRQVTRSEARRCHARVVGTVADMRTTYVKLRECTPELLKTIPKKWLACEGRTPEDDEEELLQSGKDIEDPYMIQKLRKRAVTLRPFPKKFGVYDGEEAIIPIDCVTPLRPCRGKSGGMNHCMEILNHYLRHHSSTFTIIKQSRNGAIPPLKGMKRRSSLGGVGNKNAVDANMLFAIFDCRHMGQKGFWDAVIPYFYRYKYLNNPWARELMIDREIAFVQLPQTFTALTLDSDVFDMRNEYLFRLANNVRNGVGAITSCGTNAVWNYDIFYQENPLEHRFNEDTMIEDTASSHDVIIEGRKGVYHFQRLVLGARKDTTDYLAAVFRWSRGAVQLAFCSFWYPRTKYIWPWTNLIIHVAPLVSTVIYLQFQKLDECHRTNLAGRSGLIPCRLGPLFGLIFDPVYLLYAAFMVALAIVSFKWDRVGANLVMFENVTYFFSSQSAFFWLLVPLYMCIAKGSLPPILDTQLVTIGGLYFQFLMGVIIFHIKGWSPLENGAAPSNQSLLRAQQKFFVTAPLHLLAIILGCRDGIGILFFHKDASRWSSFDNKMAMTSVKVWSILMVMALFSAMGTGIYWFVTEDDTADEKIRRLIGILMAFIVLYLIETPVRALFFFKSVVKEKQKPSRLARCLSAVFGGKTVLTPDILYLGLWAVVLVLALQAKPLGKSPSLLNIKSRCDINPAAAGCKDSSQYVIRRVPSQFDDD